MLAQILPKPLDIMGVPVTPFESYSQVGQCVDRLIADKEKAFCVAINPEKIYRAGKDTELMRLLNLAQIQICDGVGAAIAVRILHGKKLIRVTGVGLFYELMAQAERKGWKVFLLGASPEANEGSCHKLQAKYPLLKIVGHRDGYFKDSCEVIEQINASGADLLFVALGSPRQEQWITGHRSELNPVYCMGVGGTLDVASGRVKWAPAFFRKTGTEWLYRLICEPQRLGRQKVLPLFMLQVIQAKLQGRNKM